MRKKSLLLILSVVSILGCGHDREEFSSSLENGSTLEDGDIVQVLWHGVPVWAEIRSGLAIFSGDIVVGTVDEVEVYDGGPLPVSAGRATLGSLWDTPQHIDWTILSGCLPENEAMVEEALDMWTTATDGFFQFHHEPEPFNGPYLSQGWLQFKCATDMCVSYQVGNYGQIPHVMGVADCDDAGDVAHEVGHTLGLFHEHQRRDRNSKIKVNWMSIPFTKWINYYTYDAGFPNGQDYGPVDFDSIMMYGSYVGSYCPEGGVPCMNERGSQNTWGWSDEFSAGDIYGMARRYTDSWYTIDNENVESTPRIDPLISTFAFDQPRSMDRDLVTVGKFCDDGTASSDWNNDDILEYDPIYNNWVVYCDGLKNGTNLNADGFPFDEVRMGDFTSDPADDEDYDDFITNEPQYNNWIISEKGSGTWTNYNSVVNDDVEDVNFGTFCLSSYVEGTVDAIRQVEDPDLQQNVLEVSCGPNAPWETFEPISTHPTELLIADFNEDGWSDMVRKSGTSTIEMAFGGTGYDMQTNLPEWYTPYTFYRVSNTLNMTVFTVDDLHVGKFEMGGKNDIVYRVRDQNGVWRWYIMREMIHVVESSEDVILFYNVVSRGTSEYATLNTLPVGDLDWILADLIEYEEDTQRDFTEIVMRIPSDIQ